jgi:hypothetical protein
MEMSAEQWVAEFARRICQEPPSREQMGELLKLAATAAHASERTAAPLACWLAGRAGVEPGELHADAEAVGEAPPEEG